MRQGKAEGARGFDAAGRGARILFIAGDSRWSGASVSLATLAKLLRSYGEDVRIILPSSGPLERVLSNYSIPYKVVKSWQWAISLDADERQLSEDRKFREEVNKKAVEGYLSTFSQTASSLCTQIQSAPTSEP